MIGHGFMRKLAGREMALHLDISESVAGSSPRLPVQEIEPRLRVELALALYAQGILPFGKASELAAVSRYQLAELLDLCVRRDWSFGEAAC
jgi:hypothetical protein